MKEWFTLAELVEAKLPDLPANLTGMQRYCENHGWRGVSQFSRLVTAKTKPAWEYHYSLLSARARAALVYQNAPAADQDLIVNDRSRQLWARFEALPDAHKNICRERLAVLIDIEDMRSAGITVNTAINYHQKNPALHELPILNG